MAQHHRLSYIHLFICITLAMLLLGHGSKAQTMLKGSVTDAITQKPLPFAGIKIGSAGQGTLADLDGKFEISTAFRANYLEVSYMGYITQKLQWPAASEINVRLQPKEGQLNEVLIKPPYDKMRRILNLAIDNRENNNPEKYERYRCRMYYKMVADAALPDSVLNKDTSQDGRELKAFLNDQHLLMSETYSIRNWRRPQHLQEDVVGTRFSGFKKSLFTGMVTDILPFHAYNDFLTLNGKDYSNPVSKGFFQHYDFNLVDEFLQGTDTVWILSFRPQKGYDGLKGTVYINSDHYAISSLLATVYDKQLDRHIRIEQQYQKTGDRWFPKQLNYILNYSLKSEKDHTYDVVMKGTSTIDSVSWDDTKVRFDKAHTVRLDKNADELSDTAWAHLRPMSIDHKEARTYVYMDSLFEHTAIGKMVPLISKIGEGKIPVSVIDLNLNRIYSYNKYEKTRLGLGAQTNEKLLKWMSIGGWFGYGFNDKQWKYGGLLEFYADRYKEFVFRFSYDNDLRDPGRISLNRDLDRNYLKRYLMSRVDNIISYSGSVRKRFGYWNLELSATQEQITPRYVYAYRDNDVNYSQFTAKEASLNIRYAYAERTAPAFGMYYRTGSKYPIAYGRITKGVLSYGPVDNNYTQAVAALLWHKHINRLGYEHIQVSAGKSWSDRPLPLSKLFAGNGYRYSNDFSLYSFGGLLTMYPYDYYSDQYVSLIFKHDFDWKLFKIEPKKGSLSSAPFISIGYNYLNGTLAHPEVHKYVSIGTPYKGYHETGLLLNNILRYKYFNLYYFTLNVGYFYHWTPTLDPKNGRFVLGLGLEL